MPEQRIDNLGAVGLNSDVSPTLLPLNAVTDMYNVMTVDGSLRSIFGERVLIDPLDVKPLYHASYVDFSQRQWVIVSDGVSIWAYDVRGGSLEITPVTPWTGGFVSFTVLNGVLVINSASDGMFYWPDQAAALVAAPGWDSEWRCKQVASYRYNLFALGMTETNVDYPHKIRWSTSAEDGAIPTIWTIAADNDAGSDVLGETGGAIVGGAIVGGQLWIVKDNAIYAVKWIGGQYIFRTDRLVGGLGTRNPRGFCEMRGNLAVLTSSDVRVFDGRQSRSLVDGRVRRGIFLGLSEEFWELSQIFYHSHSSTLLVAQPKAGSIGQLTEAIVYNTEENTFGHKHLGFAHGFIEALTTTSGENALTWDEMGDSDHVVCEFDPVTLEETNCTGGVATGGPNEVWDNQINETWNKGLRQPSAPDIVMFEADAEDTTWKMSIVNVGDTNSDGSAKTCTVRRTGIPIQGASGVAQINGCWVEVRGQLEDGDGNALPVRMRFGSQFASDSPVVWADRVYDIYPGQNVFVDPIIVGRFIAWELESFGVGNWRLPAITLDWQPAGMF